MRSDRRDPRLQAVARGTGLLNRCTQLKTVVEATTHQPIDVAIVFWRTSHPRQVTGTSVTRFDTPLGT